MLITAIKLSKAFLKFDDIAFSDAFVMKVGEMSESNFRKNSWLIFSADKTVSLIG